MSDEFVRFVIGVRSENKFSDPRLLRAMIYRGFHAFLQEKMAMVESRDLAVLRDENDTFYSIALEKMQEEYEAWQDIITTFEKMSSDLPSMTEADYRELIVRINTR